MGFDYNDPDRFKNRKPQPISSDVKTTKQDPEEIKAYINRLKGEQPMPAQQVQINKDDVVAMLKEGYSNQAIADHFHIAAGTLYAKKKAWGLTNKSWNDKKQKSPEPQDEIEDMNGTAEPKNEPAKERKAEVRGEADQPDTNNPIISRAAYDQAIDRAANFEAEAAEERKEKEQLRQQLEQLQQEKEAAERAGKEAQEQAGDYEQQAKKTQQLLTEMTDERDQEHKKYKDAHVEAEKLREETKRAERWKGVARNYEYHHDKAISERDNALQQAEDWKKKCTAYEDQLQNQPTIVTEQITAGQIDADEEDWKEKYKVTAAALRVHL